MMLKQAVMSILFNAKAPLTREAIQDALIADNKFPEKNDINHVLSKLHREKQVYVSQDTCQHCFKTASVFGLTEQGRMRTAVFEHTIYNIAEASRNDL